MKWIGLGMRVLPLILSTVQAVEQFLTGRGRGQEKQEAAVRMIRVALQTVEVGAERDLLDDQEVEAATRAAMRAYVALQNVIARKTAARGAGRD